MGASLSQAASSTWLHSASDSYAAASKLALQHPRSACSRYYFAAYAAAHALLLRLGQTPPARGNWPHESLADQLGACLATRAGSRSVSVYRQSIRNAHRLRVVADYGVRFPMSDSDAALARRCAGQVLHLARRIAG